ncbi:hypothetical protein MMC07_004059 [Pseudocyphellaria aurata]|nr:hypothetical protein [Pseudocyphellaria aurata]
MDAPNDQVASNMGNDLPESRSILTEEIDDDRETISSGSDSANGAAPTISFSNDILSTSNHLGFLSLPRELRDMVYRQTVVQNCIISTDLRDRRGSTSYWHPIFGTCQLVCEEALQVLVTQNTFFIGNRYPRRSITNIPGFRDMIRNVHYEAPRHAWHNPYPRNWPFMATIREFGLPAITRDTFSVVFRVSPFHCFRTSLPLWYTRRLRAFTNFQTVRIEYLICPPHPPARPVYIQACDFHRVRLEPWLGPAEFVADGLGLLFHPQQYRNSLPPKVDWMEHLDGIRLDWIQDPSPNGGN